MVQIVHQLPMLSFSHDIWKYTRVKCALRCSLNMKEVIPLLIAEMQKSVRSVNTRPFQLGLIFDFFCRVVPWQRNGPTNFLSNVAPNNRNDLVNRLVPSFRFAIFWTCSCQVWSRNFCIIFWEPKLCSSALFYAFCKSDSQKTRACWKYAK